MTGAELAGSCSLLWVPACALSLSLQEAPKGPQQAKTPLIHFPHPIHPLCGVSRAALPSQGSPPLEFQRRGASPLALTMIIEGNGLTW